MNIKTASRKILFLTSRLPYPPIGGDRLKSNWLLKILSKHFKVHLVSISEENVPNEFYQWMEELRITYKIFRKNKISFYLNAGKFILNYIPLQVNYYYFKDLQDYINSIYANFDLLFATLIRTAEYIIDKDKPKILEITDSIALNYLRSKNKSTSLKWKNIYKIEANRLLRYENKCLNRFDKVLFVNREEAEYYNIPQKAIHLPNGVNEKLLEYENINKNYNEYVVFFGKMNYQPNIDAVLYFTEKVLPHLNKNIKFAIVGAYPVKIIRNLEKKHPNVIVTGYVEDPYIILKSALCIVAPMQTGGGIQNKILESMALGTINIVSSLAAKPIGAANEKDFLIIDDPIQIANKINDIFKYPEKYDHIKTNSRDFIKNNFTWSSYEKKLLQVIEEVLLANQSKSTP